MWGSKKEDRPGVFSVARYAKDKTVYAAKRTKGEVSWFFRFITNTWCKIRNLVFFTVFAIVISAIASPLLKNYLQNQYWYDSFIVPILKFISYIIVSLVFFIARWRNKTAFMIFDFVLLTLFIIGNRMNKGTKGLALAKDVAIVLAIATLSQTLTSLIDFVLPNKGCRSKEDLKRERADMKSRL